MTIVKVEKDSVIYIGRDVQLINLSVQTGQRMPKCAWGECENRVLQKKQ